MPGRLNHSVPHNRANTQAGASFEFSVAEFGDGSLAFASPDHVERVKAI
jgi:hypothetical protein